MHYKCALTISLLTNFRLKEFSDDNFKSNENGGKFSERVKNTEGKGRIAGYKQFLFLPLSFQKNYTADM